MAFTLTLGCGDSYTPHRLHFTDDGRVLVDPDKHDEELEQSLAALGARLPNCVRTAEALRSIPMALLQELTYFYRDATTKAVPWPRMESYVGAHIGADAVEHAAKQFDAPSPERQLALEIVSIVRRLQSSEREKLEDLEQLEHANQSITDLYGAAQKDSPYEHLSYAASWLTSFLLYHERSHTTVNEVLLNAQRAVATQQATATLADAAQDAEARWQSRQLIRGIAATLKGEPWPSIS